jgi:hypothetical protein
MLEIKEKKLNSNITFSIFETIISDEKMNQDIIKVIDKQGNKQNYSTNVKAQMTEWNMINEPGFDNLSKTISDLSIYASKKKYNVKIKPVVHNIWGIKYKSEEIALTHDHWPALWSCVYYINPPKNAPGLLFTEANVERQLENGLLIMFEGHIKHEVRKIKYTDYRYVVSANVYNDFR